MADWHVYLIRCRDGSLYTGITTDVERRFKEHQENAGAGAKYLRGRGPLRLVYRRKLGDRGLAQAVESGIKRLPKAKKEALLADDGLITGIIERAGGAKSG